MYISTKCSFRLPIEGLCCPSWVLVSLEGLLCPVTNYSARVGGNWTTPNIFPHTGDHDRHDQQSMGRAEENRHFGYVPGLPSSLAGELSVSEVVVLPQQSCSMACGSQ